MTIALWCVLAGLILPVVWTSVAKAGGPNKMPLKYNKNPREFLATVKGMQKRADWAQQNAFEAFPAFAAAVIIAHIAGAEQATADFLAALWLLMRVAHGVSYLADWSSLRSIFYFVAMGCVVGLFIAAA